MERLVSWRVLPLLDKSSLLTTPRVLTSITKILAITIHCQHISFLVNCLIVGLLCLVTAAPPSMAYSSHTWTQTLGLTKYHF